LFGVNKSTTNESPVKEQNEQNVEKPEIDLTKENEKLIEENKKLVDLVKEIDDKYKRSLADGENTRIRMRKQVDDAKIYGIQSFCKDLLDVADVLNAAIDSVPKDAVNDGNQVLKNLFLGFQMTEQQLQSVFKRHGLTQMNPIGEKFNPNEHHALFEAVEPGKEPGSVAVVTKVGYKLHERTVRPAMVGVVKASN